MNWSASETALVPTWFVTVMSATPAELGGETTLSEVLECTVTLVAGIEPNCTVVPLVNPVPLTVTVVPPETSPKLPLTPVTVGVLT